MRAETEQAPTRNARALIVLTAANVIWLTVGIVLVAMEWPVLAGGAILLPQALLLYYQPLAFVVVNAAVIALVGILTLVRGRAGGRLFALWKYATYVGFATLLLGPLSFLVVLLFGLSS